jgi:hypothetical protein
MERWSVGVERQIVSSCRELSRKLEAEGGAKGREKLIRVEGILCQGWGVWRRKSDRALESLEIGNSRRIDSRNASRV